VAKGSWFAFMTLGAGIVSRSGNHLVLASALCLNFIIKCDLPITIPFSKKNI
jgi:hypothetical protein